MQQVLASSAGRSKPPYRAEHIGSLLRPPALLAARKSFEEGRSTADQLRTAEDRCIRDAVKLQESLGFQAVTDGEMRRSSWRSEVVNRVQGFESAPAIGGLDLARDGLSPPEHIGSAPYAQSRLIRRRPIVAGDCEYVRHLTGRSVKATLPSPSYMHFLRGPLCADKLGLPRPRFILRGSAVDLCRRAGGSRRQGNELCPIGRSGADGALRSANTRTIEQRGENVEDLVETYIGLVIASSPRSRSG